MNSPVAPGAIVGREAQLATSIDAVPTRGHQLGTGLSCLADHNICSSEPIRLVRERPLQTASDRAIGHATGTARDFRVDLPTI
jgi:hypothetical protein